VRLMLPKMPDISSLPVEQQVIAWVVFALISILAFMVAKSQVDKGKNAAKDEAAHASVAAVIVDPGPLNRATAAVEGFTMTQVEMNMSVKNMSHNVGELAEQVRELAKQVEILTIVMRK
jgi:hypothetical protein